MRDKGISSLLSILSLPCSPLSSPITLYIARSSKSHLSLAFGSSLWTPAITKYEKMRWRREGGDKRVEEEDTWKRGGGMGAEEERGLLLMLDYSIIGRFASTNTVCHLLLPVRHVKQSVSSPAFSPSCFPLLLSCHLFYLPSTSLLPPSLLETNWHVQRDSRHEKGDLFQLTAAAAVRSLRTIDIIRLSLRYCSSI